MHEYVRITRLFINCLTVFVSRDGNRCKNRLLYCLDFKWHNLVICFFFVIWLFLLKSLCVSDPSRQSDSCLRQTICWKDSSSGNFKISISKYWLIFTWKVSMNYFIIPCKYGTFYLLEGTSCWRRCGEQAADYTHVHKCPALMSLWEEDEKTFNYNFDLHVKLRISDLEKPYK